MPEVTHHQCRAGLLRQLANNDGNKAAIAAAGGMELLNCAAAAHPSNPAVLEQACSPPGHKLQPGKLNPLFLARLMW